MIKLKLKKFFNVTYILIPPLKNEGPPFLPSPSPRKMKIVLPPPFFQILNFLQPPPPLQKGGGEDTMITEYIHIYQTTQKL